MVSTLSTTQKENFNVCAKKSQKIRKNIFYIEQLLHRKTFYLISLICLQFFVRDCLRTYIFIYDTAQTRLISVFCRFLYFKRPLCS